MADIRLVKAKCVVCGETFEADDCVEVVYYHGEPLKAHRPCIAEAVDSARMARQMPDTSSPKKETVKQKRMRLHERLALGLRFATKYAKELAECPGGTTEHLPRLGAAETGALPHKEL